MCHDTHVSGIKMYSIPHGDINRCLVVTTSGSCRWKDGQHSVIHSMRHGSGNDTGKKKEETNNTTTKAVRV